MDFAYRFADPATLYLNVTNRCTNRCVFCVSQCSAGLGDGVLRGGPEPDLQGLLTAIDERGGAEQYAEIVWCGFGEPTFRLDLILAASPVLRDAGPSIRLNTNGHGSLIHGRDILPELGEVLDAISVSLNAPSAERYDAVCRPDPDTVAGQPATESFYDAVLDTLGRAPRWIDDVRATVVGAVLSEAEIRACRQLASALGVHRFEVR